MSELPPYVPLAGERHKGPRSQDHAAPTVSHNLGYQT